MKRKLAAIWLLCTLLLAGCRTQDVPNPLPDDQQNTPIQDDSNDRNDDDNTVQDGTPAADETYNKLYRNDAGEEVASLALVTPGIAGEGEAAQAMRDYYQNWRDKQIAYADDEFFEMAKAGEQEAKETGGVFTPYVLEARYEVQRDDGAVYSVLRDIYENTGGVHPNVAYQAENFSKANGGRLTADDLFSVPAAEYRERIQTLVVEQAEQRAKDGEAAYYGNYQEDLMQVWDPRDFVLTTEGITFFWQNYAIGPYVSGTQFFTVPYAELEDILSKEWLPQ